ncbi:MAG: type VI secretion system baseplate subunit TssF [Planctomycetes bacterium]|nr:type VI secretion system baseplate subunit TssF [Planctomycetota bacterium]
MATNTYYQDELRYLREVGPEFARANPEIARYLSDRGSDPDVERVLAGVAFMCGRVRQKLDDELPELTASMMGLLWPQYLRPVCSMTIMELSPDLAAMQAPQVVEAGAEFASTPIDGTRCRYRSAWPMTLRPCVVDNVRLESAAARPVQLIVRLRAPGKATLDKLELDSVRFFMFGDPMTSFTLYLLLAAHVDHVVVSDGSSAANRPERRLAAGSVSAAGLDRASGVLPYPKRSFPGYRLLQEYFACKERFLFIDVAGIAGRRGTRTHRHGGVGFYVQPSTRHPSGRFPRECAAALRSGIEPLRAHGGSDPAATGTHTAPGPAEQSGRRQPKARRDLLDRGGPRVDSLRRAGNARIPTVLLVRPRHPRRPTRGGLLPDAFDPERGQRRPPARDGHIHLLRLGRQRVHPSRRRDDLDRASLHEPRPPHRAPRGRHQRADRQLAVRRDVSQSYQADADDQSAVGQGAALATDLPYVAQLRLADVRTALQGTAAGVRFPSGTRRPGGARARPYDGGDRQHKVVIRGAPHTGGRGARLEGHRRAQ